MAASGSRDCSVIVWGLAAGAAVATLRGHAGPVLALATLPPPEAAAACGWRLVSASKDRTLRVWALPPLASVGAAAVDGDYACLASVPAFPEESPQYVRCLAVIGGGGGRAAVLVAGSGSSPAAAAEMHEVRVWALEDVAEVAEGSPSASSSAGKRVVLVGGNRQLQPAGRPIQALEVAELGEEQTGKGAGCEVLLAAVRDESVVWNSMVFE
jgi:WD40 repeat protein